MNHDHFPYIYENGRWVRDEAPAEGFTLRGIAEAVLGCVALSVCIVAVAMLFLCG